MSDRSLMRKAKEVIFSKMEDLGEIDVETVMNLIRPHFIFDIASAREQALRRKANSVMKQFKDTKGIRSCFSCKDAQGNSKYINVDTTRDIKILDKIESQLDKKYKGLNLSKKKVKRRRQELSGQITFEDMSQ